METFATKGTVYLDTSFWCGLYVALDKMQQERFRNTKADESESLQSSTDHTTKDAFWRETLTPHGGQSHFLPLQVCPPSVLMNLEST